MRRAPFSLRLRLAPLVPALLLAGCASEPPKIAAPPPPPPKLHPEAPSAPQPTDWRDIAISPGHWVYAADATGSSASYGEVRLRCLKTARQIAIAHTGAAAALTVRTSYGSRTLAAVAGVAMLAAGDPLLDQIAFSRARFSIEAPGTGMVMMPAWAEPARVIEDCRA